jgi:hypothetical protein
MNTCEVCGAEIVGPVYGASIGTHMCGVCVDERWERAWEQPDESDTAAYYAPAPDRYATYPTNEAVTKPAQYTAPQLGESDAMPLDSEQRVYFTRAGDNLPICEVFSPQEVKRLEFIKYRIATGQIESGS